MAALGESVLLWSKEKMAKKLDEKKQILFQFYIGVEELRKRLGHLF
jgi:hypothetical protein